MAINTCWNDDEGTWITLSSHIVRPPAIDRPEVTLRSRGVIDHALRGRPRNRDDLHVSTRRSAVEFPAEVHVIHVRFHFALDLHWTIYHGRERGLLVRLADG
ncbi:hypothetical protein AVEN_157207-1 [Araneus ventricosus]|uniref:Uncharacterized protein n=1 Tax=Araneus ventricosus TaxID=182803 RepID=A0A4Y2EFD9_ARAVE|nr:hypothetical protein AVEN_157207-1 [Araneus ventricosus]